MFLSQRFFMMTETPLNVRFNSREQFKRLILSRFSISP